jgi:alkylhydroperoxidase family enzyme
LQPRIVEYWGWHFFILSIRSPRPEARRAVIPRPSSRQAGRAIITFDVIEPFPAVIFYRLQKNRTGQEGAGAAALNQAKGTKTMANFTVHSIETAPEKSKPTLRGMQEKFGFLPNIMGTMAENPVLLNGFAASFGSFHGGSLDECEKQVLLLTNAVTLKCPWTIAAHSTFAIEDGVAESDVRAMRSGKLPGNPKYAALSEISKALLENRGNVTEAAIAKFTSAGYSKAQIFEVVLGVGISMITATTTNLAGTPIDDRFKAQSLIAA